jgi:hypothetical protein
MLIMLTTPANIQACRFLFTAQQLHGADSAADFRPDVTKEFHGVVLIVTLQVAETPPIATTAVPLPSQGVLPTGLLK